jgi:hypothetical protein
MSMNPRTISRTRKKKEKSSLDRGRPVNRSLNSGLSSLPQIEDHGHEIGAYQGAGKETQTEGGQYLCYQTAHDEEQRSFPEQFESIL